MGFDRRTTERIMERLDRLRPVHAAGMAGLAAQTLRGGHLGYPAWEVGCMGGPTPPT